MDLSDDSQAAFEARMKLLRRHQLRLSVVGGALVVLSPLVVGISVAAGFPWMRWFWIVSIGTFVVGLGLSIGTTTAERMRWRRTVIEIARTDLEHEREVHP